MVEVVGVIEVKVKVKVNPVELKKKRKNEGGQECSINGLA